jgi:GR25 family glycosyltransferase involved in LPS biosynthesis
MEHTLYINLSERTDRKEQVENEFKSVHIDAYRVNAISHVNGALGCSLSHIKCIQIAKEQKWSCVCICEDDIMFTNPVLLMESLELFLKSGVPWDVLLLGSNIAPPYSNVTDHWMKVSNAQTTTGYIVKEHYYDKLLENFQEGITRKYPIDIYWKLLQQKDNWYILLPLSVTQRPSYSNIEKRMVNYTNAMLNDKIIYS